MTLAPGHYKARAIDGDFGVAGTGTKQAAVSFEIADGEAKGQRITWYGYFTPSTSERTIESLRHCGCTFPDDRLDNLEGLSSNEVVLVLEEDGTDENGDPRVKVRWVNRLGGGVALGTRLSEQEKRALAAEMRGFVVASRAKAGGAAPTPNAARTPPLASRPAQSTSAPRAPSGNARGPQEPSRPRGSMNDDIPY